MIRIRLRRVGKKRHPYYRVVVANKTAKRDGAFLETLGSYDPHASPPLVQLDEAKTREWLGKGAQPSEAAEKVLRRAGILGAVAVAEPPKEDTPAEKPAARTRAARAKAEAAPEPQPEVEAEAAAAGEEA